MNIPKVTMSLEMLKTKVLMSWIFFAFLGGCFTHTDPFEPNEGVKISGVFNGDFECTNLDADEASIFIADSGTEGTISFVPSANDTSVRANLTGLLIDNDNVSFSAVFDEVEGEDAPLTFVFSLVASGAATTLDGTAVLTTASASTENCDAEFFKQQ